MSVYLSGSLCMHAYSSVPKTFEEKKLGKNIKFRDNGGGKNIKLKGTICTLAKNRKRNIFFV